MLIKKIFTVLLFLCFSGIGTTCNAAEINQSHSKNNIEMLNFIPHSMMRMEMTSTLASEWDGIVGSSDVQSEELFKGRLELPWLDGNYIVWNTGMGNFPDIHYGAEYDKNKNMTGFVVIQETEAPGANIAIYQYDYKNFEGPLKNMMIFYKDKNKSSYWYSADGKLQGVCYAGKAEAKTQSAAKNINVLKQLSEIMANPKAKKLIKEN